MLPSTKEGRSIAMHSLTVKSATLLQNSEVCDDGRINGLDILRYGDRDVRKAFEDVKNGSALLSGSGVPRCFP